MEQLGKTNTTGSGQYINLPMRLYLTGLGVSSMRDKTGLERKLDATSNSLPSIATGRVLASSLKEYVISSRVNQIEIVQDDLTINKNDLIDTTKLIVYSLLYRLFPIDLLVILKQRGLTFPYADARSEQNWTAANPKEYHQLKLDIFNAAKSILVRDRQSTEKNAYYKQKSAASVAVKLLNMVPIRIYRALLSSRGGSTRDIIVESTVALIDKYLSRTFVSDCLSGAFLEWVECLDKVNRKRIFSLWRAEYEETNRRGCPIDNIQKGLEEESPYREEILDFVNSHDLALKINWKFGSGQQNSRAGDLNSASVLRIRLSGKGQFGDWMRKTIQTQLLTQPAPPDKKSPVFGYTQSLRAVCQSQAMAVFMQSFENKERDETVLSFSMHIAPI
ncbi:MAG: hypothetical protein LBC99_02200 [Spirochaetota bacterium]|jgi:hypothetical protein|nr:hypothetical protein [Spirochaetota bacterium]